MSDLAVIDKPQFTPEQMALIKSTIAPGATANELNLFLYRCANLGLDPLKPGQIYFIKYGNSPGTIVVGIEGFRARAAKTGRLSGIKRGALRDGDGRLIGAFAEVYRTDWKEPAREEVPLSEYNTQKGNWLKMPETMIKKVAEAAALRMAFPDDLGGVYTKEEMDQAAEEAPRKQILPEREPVGNGNTEPLVYKIPFGKWAQRSLEDVYKNFGPEQMASYIAYIEKDAEKKGQPVSDRGMEFIARVEAFLGVMELSAHKSDLDHHERDVP